MVDQQNEPELTILGSFPKFSALINFSDNASHSYCKFLDQYRQNLYLHHNNDHN